MIEVNDMELTDSNVKIIQEELKNKFELVVDNHGHRSKVIVGKEELDNLIVILSKVTNHLKLDRKQLIIDLTKDLFKAFRNSMVANADMQNYIVNKTNALIDVRLIVIILSSIEDEKKTKLCLKIIFQFLINLVVSNKNSAFEVWSHLSDIYVTLFKRCDTYYTSALLYNILLNHSHITFELEIYELIIDLFEKHEENEYVIFLIEFFIKNDHISGRYNMFSVERRMVLLEIVKQNLIVKTNGNFNLSKKQVTTFTTQFKLKSDCVLKTITDYLEKIDVREVVLLLEILASISSNEEHLKYLQNDKSLLINCIFLLRGVHESGKKGNEEFSPVRKLSQLNSKDTDSIVFGLKVDLIRIIANLCWKHQENQHCVGEMHAIPVLLDCCNIDAKNPFIIQWVIMAVRILCENNRGNQQIIASLKQQGTVNTQVLNEIGLALHNDGDKTLHLVPLDDLKKKLP